MLSSLLHYSFAFVNMVRAVRFSLLIPASVLCLQVAATTTPEKLTALHASLQEFSKSKDKPEGTLLHYLLRSSRMILLL